MQIVVICSTGQVYPVECESTDTIAHIIARLHEIVGIPPDQQRLIFAGKQINGAFSVNRTLAEAGIQEGSKFHLTLRLRGGGAGEIERLQKPEKGYLHYADAFKHGWREEHGEALLHLLLKICRDGRNDEGNITEEAWLQIQSGLNNSMKCSFQIDFLQERLRDYMQLYSLLAGATSPIVEWDRENKIIRIESPWWEAQSPCTILLETRKIYIQYHPEVLLLCGEYIPYFDTLEEVCSLLSTRQSPEQQVSETSNDIKSQKLLHQDVPQLSNIRTTFRKIRKGLK